MGFPGMNHTTVTTFMPWVSITGTDDKLVGHLSRELAILTLLFNIVKTVLSI